jgi:hypothetical protein
MIIDHALKHALFRLYVNTTSNIMMKYKYLYDGRICMLYVKITSR